ncbi:PHP domain-containing protein [Gloeobacter kilaueensis]|uniref:PHP domain protein n=1 Tax=Gloeobacter kilaueensis (strain ATCC BAA-2537 / CCAP 1431/1 / ULC 316 / JS1) TaxID=1183438 RepID=U5QIG8_GLOK1|nr:PHP domain-containing protein [Gloeobacter kilaueensis]AGY57450.1 PHP domain protein [Gloeobacter kilaueensis JS1]
MIELHCHTTCSDGTLTPGELVAAAAGAGIQALAITDHDTLTGWDEARLACAQYGLELVPGVELSTLHNGCSLHVLGFYPDQAKLTPFLEERHAARVRRARSTVERLADLGYPIEMPRASTPGRFHIARALKEAGYIKDEQQAFQRWIGEGKPAYVPYEHLSAAEGIERLRECGAVTVWAHPMLFRGGNVEAVLPVLVAAGLQGLEVYHCEHTPRQSARLEVLCREWSLIATGGSDFHGDNKDGVSLNMLRLPLSLLEPLKRLANLPTAIA